MLLSVIIVNHNVKLYLEQCLYSVLRAGSSVDMEIIVVDNHSSDGSRHYLEPAFPQVQFIWNTENLGFAKACNIGWQRAAGRHILFLNPDTIVGEECFEYCLRFQQEAAHCGALGVRMINERGLFLKESKRGFPSPLVSFFRLTGLSALFPKSALFAQYYLGHLPELETHEIDVVAGAFMMVKKEVLDEVGGFDESFFMYGEDIDLSYRIQKQGYRNYYYPEVTILHFKGRSTPHKNLQYLKTFYGAMKIFIDKHYGKSEKKFLSFLLQAGIRLKIIAARISLVLSGLLRRETKKSDTLTQKILIVGMEEREAGYLKQLIAPRYGLAQKSLVFLPVDKNMKINTSPAGAVLKNDKASKIILCEGNLTFRELIALREALSWCRAITGFHARGSRGIPGEV